MSDTVIRVENLGKKYIIGHQTQERYTALRDVIANGAKDLFKSFRNQNFKPANYQEEFWALKDVSFEIKQGDRVGIIGRNGAGKSTLLKILSRITEPTKGNIKIKGRVASLLEVGTGFHPELTGRENIYLNGAILGMSKAEIKRKFDEIVAFAEVEKFLDTPVKRYSSGMYVRLAFAVAAHLEPEILIVDEVLAVGDVQFQKKCLGKMEDVGKEGTTVIFVSHNMAAVKRLTNTAIWLKQGKVISHNLTLTTIEKYYQDNIFVKNTAFKEFTDLDRAKGVENRIKILSIILKNKKGIQKKVFSLKEEIIINIKFCSEMISEYFEVGYSIKTIEGEILFTSSSADSGKFYNIAKGVYMISSAIDPNYLKQGRYWIQLGITCERIQDFIPDAIEFEIVINDEHKNPLSLPGSFDFKYQWYELEKMS